jgi:hypothetical protein
VELDSAHLSNIEAANEFNEAVALAVSPPAFTTAPDAQRRP